MLSPWDLCSCCVRPLSLKKLLHSSYLFIDKITNMNM
jgi:hypothetical protein